MKQIHIHQITLPSNDEFSKRFNYVSELFAKYQDESLSEEEKDKAFEAYFHAKFALEMGMPLPTSDSIPGTSFESNL